ncbi:MAG: adenylate/guanylate cyclase domain-containing protein [Desulfamplus sp.]|nr:adenylate/guanylate cyclase domain-containing protein [Desulfamplus sp.]
MRLKPFSGSREWFHGILSGVAAALIALALWHFGLLDIWEGKTWDWRESIMAKPSSATGEICLILVDQGSLDWMSQNNGLNWPWPREIYSVVVDFCKRNQAKAVAFDVLFTEPSSYGVEDDRTFGKAAADYGKVASAAFLKKLSGSHTKWPQGAGFEPIVLEGANSWLKTPAGQACLFPRAVMPIPELTATSAILCNVQQEPDPDGIYRRTRMVSFFDSKAVPSLGLGIYFAADNELKPATVNGLKPAADRDSGGKITQEKDITKGSEKKFTGEIIQHADNSSGILNIANRKIPLDAKGEAILRYRGPSGTHKTYSAAAIIQSEIEFRNAGGSSHNTKNQVQRQNQDNYKESFRDKYVFFSFSAPGLFDLRSSPVDSVYPGVEIQATMLDNFLAGDFIRDTPGYFVIILVLFWSVIFSVCMTFFKGVIVLLLAGTSSIVMPVGISLLAYNTGIWMPLIVIETAAVTAVLFSLGLNYVREGRQRRFIKSAFSQYLSPLFIEQLIRHPEKLKLGGERKELSIFFSDLQGFTSISEKLSPEDLTSLLNNYLSAMTQIIHEEGGTVDKYEGDAIIAFWNAPLDVDNHEACAVRAALRCQQKLAQMRPEMKKIVGTDMLMRIGLNTGIVVVGNMGSHSRFDYTMLGDAVNLAARLEGANKEFGTYTMISASTHKAIKDYTHKSIKDDTATFGNLVSDHESSGNAASLTCENLAYEGVLSENGTAEIKDASTKMLSGGCFAFRELARLAVVGKKEAITVFEPMFSDQFESNQDIYRIYDNGLQLFYNGQLQEALEIFSTISDIDPPALAYVRKCNELSSEFSANPLPDNWSGVWTMTRK